MSFTTDLLDLAKKAQAIESDYRLAQLLGLTRSTVSGLRRGVAFPSNSTAYKLAELAGMDAGRALLGCMVDRVSATEGAAGVDKIAAQLDALARSTGQ